MAAFLELQSMKDHFQENSNEARVQEALHRFLVNARKGGSMDENRFLDSLPAPLRSEAEPLFREYVELVSLLGAEPCDHSGRVLGDYRLLERIGRGGMGEVWSAIQLSLEKKVAVKLLYPIYNLRASSLQRFQKEAAVGSRLIHPGIAQIYGVGEDEGDLYIVQELIEGGRSLADWLDEHRKRPDLNESHFRRVAEIHLAVAEAMAAAHEVGVWHRDLKPANIMLLPNGQPKVVDFGLAFLEGDLGLTRTRDRIGTPYYMSPEQINSDLFDLDHRTDVFSLGTSLFESMTLQRAFEGASFSAVARRIQYLDPEEPRKLVQAPKSLSNVCMRAIAKHPRRRYATMKEFADDLRRYLCGEAVSARKPGWFRVGEGTLRRNPKLSGLLFAAVIALISLAGLHRQVQVEKERAELGWNEADRVKVALEAKVDSLNQFTGGMVKMVNRLQQNLRSSSGLNSDQFLASILELAGEHLETEPYLHAILGLQVAHQFSLSGRYTEAEALYRRMLPVMAEHLGDSDSSLAEYYLRAGNNALAGGNMTLAKERLEIAATMYQEENGHEGDKAFDARLNLAAGFINERNFAEARSLLTSLLEQGADLSDSRNRALLIRLNLAILDGEERKYAAAIESMLKLEQEYLPSLGSHHPLMQQLAISLGTVYALQGNLKQSDHCFQRAWQSYLQTHSPDHPEVLRSGLRFGLSRLQLNDPETAREVFLQLLDSGYQPQDSFNAFLLEVAKSGLAWSEFTCRAEAWSRRFTRWFVSETGERASTAPPE
ncbi:MAG: serine/threonine protein kinase [Planctomycetota bacterium]|nr:MAG: serine/threonine protein kinase [Planctomycetota bacterium]